MQLFNLLAGTQITIFGGTFPVALNWIGKIIRWIIGGFSAVGVGIIVFSLVLKLVVLPFDIYQRISMRKQNTKMKENQEKMEKLQKQYANDKAMYNQKLMEMYKANGISMFSSCLPMILSLVIFIVAINAFNAYAQYAAIENYNYMVQAYNEQLLEYSPEITDGNISDYQEDGKDYLLVKENGKYIYILANAEYDKTQYPTPVEYILSLDNMNANKTYYVDVDAVYADYKTDVDAAIEASKGEDGVPSLSKEDACKDLLIGKAQTAVVEVYNTVVKDKTSFLWIKNVWQTDASYKSPVLSYSDFKTSASREEFRINGKDVSFNKAESGGYTNAYKKTTYNLVTEKLDKQKDQANGYYILILLSIGTILLQQWISMRSQKEQNKFSSVDGQGASQQKMMMIIMTVMFAIFAFMYSAAFSLYMITGNVLSMIMTVVINKIVDVVLAKKEEKALQDQYNRRFRGTRPVSTRGDKSKKDKK